MLDPIERLQLRKDITDAVGKAFEKNREAEAETETAKIRERYPETPSMIFDHLTGEMHYVDPETAKIRKHTHDTLWAVLAGFIAGAATVVIFGMIMLAILSYALG